MAPRFSRASIRSIPKTLCNESANGYSRLFAGALTCGLGCAPALLKHDSVLTDGTRMELAADTVEQVRWL
jgi:hypothetical protein